MSDNICGCGCGKPLLCPMRTFLHGHNFRTLSNISIRRRAQTFWQNMTSARSQSRTEKMKVGLKRYWTVSKRRTQAAYTKRTWRELTQKKRNARVAATIAGAQVSPNKHEQKLAKLLSNHFPNMFKLNVDAKVVIGGKIPDFVCSKKSKKIVVELFGNYWHGKERTGRTQSAEASKRKRHFGKFGFRTVVIWSVELKDENRIVSKIKRYLKEAPGE